MQQFKRANPQKMVHEDKARPINLNTCHLTAQDQGQKTSVSHGSGPSTESLDNDEALALQLQQELDRETAEATVDLEDGGLFFCQICHRDLSHMTPEGRTQHLNRCLDENEESAPARPPPSGVPDCPICGKKFKSQKSRSSHLKRCSSDMGVSPAALLQALQRQAQENAATANTLIQTVSTKRKGSTNSGLPAKKKPRKKPEPLDEETAVALALSSSLLEQEKQQRREEMPRRLEMEPPALKWRPDAGKGRGKRKKAAVHRPPPLLLVQDPQEALARLQERVSALLLRSRPPSPSTPTRGPSTLSGWTGTAPLWQKSTLLDGGSVCASDFYTAELKQFFTPWEHVKTSLSTSSRPESSVQLVGEGTPVTGTKRLPSCSQTASCPSAPSTPGAGQLPVGSQALRDLMELAEDGMTLTQYGYSAKVQRLSGFIREESEEQDELCASGFLPETAHKPSAATHNQAARTDDQQGADKSVALSRLASDLSSMVNNPQLSDLQLQVDSGDVYFAHSFMVYARCPLLAEMVHESGFGVQEEGMPAAQRVLLNDVPGQAVLALLRYLYTAHSSAPASLQPHLLELASRFDLEELQQLCHLGREEAATVGDEERYMNEEEENDNNQTDQAFTDLLRSMWNEEDDDDTGISDGAGGSEGGLLEEDHAADEVTSGSREIHEEHVNEEELEEIYEFAATQRNKEERDSVEEEERLDEQQDGDTMFTKLSEPKRDLSEKTLHLDRQLEPEPSLNCGYTRLFSESWGEYEEGGPSSTSGPPKAGSPRAKQQQTPQKAPSQLCGRTVVQSSGSLPDDDLGAPPTASNLPIAGLSPHQGGDQGGCGDERENSVELDVSLNQESCSSHSISRSRDSPSKKEEPELIVLSDSSDEMEVTILSPCELSPPRPSPRNLQSYTEIRPKQNPVSQVATLERKGSSSLELSPSGALDCSPEVSWLVPSTPVQAARKTRTSSTQTKSSIRRTQLFPKGGTSPLFSSPALPVNASTSPHKVLACTGAPESSVSGQKLNGKLLSSSSLDVNVCPKVKCDESKDGEDCAGHLLQPKLSQLSSLVHQRSPRASSKHLKTQPYSSTPLHAELRPPPPPAASLLHTHTDEQVWLRQQRETSSLESTEKPELGSFHLSPLSDPSDSGSGHLNKKRQSTSSSQSRASAESSVSTNTGVDRMRIEVRNEPEKREIKPCEESMGDGEEPEEGNENVGEADVEESSFQQSFMAMDEPPIAFNDSWGLDICAEANPGCFSLRLEDSRGSSLQEPSPQRRETAGASPPPTSKPLSSRHTVETIDGHAGVTAPSPPQGHSSPSSSLQTHKHPCSIPSPPGPVTRTSPETHNGLLDSKIWDSWEEDEGEALPLSQRVNPPARVRTPVSSHSKARRDLVPITPMPHYSDMDTPELKNKLNRFGVRPLPKRQMVLKLKEIHQYTHQLSSDSEDEASFPGGSAQLNPPPSRPASCAQTGKFKEPRPPAASSLEEDAEPLSASQGSNTSSTAASDESERSNPELIVSSDGDSDSDGGVSSSQVASRLQERLQAVRTFILSDPSLYSRILQYQPLVLSQLQQQLKAAGIRLGAAKLVDYLDSQCITFTTAKPGHSAPGRRGGKKTSKGARGGSRKKAASTRL